MSSNDKTSRPERIETDASLRAEREKTDVQLAERDSAVEKGADEVVKVARERADGLVEAAREKADVALRRAQGRASVVDRLAVVRASEDDVVTEERAAADHQLEAERAEQKQALKRLMTLEREETDERLLTERARSDTAVASRDDFLGIVSHDVRSLLGGIAMSADLLLKTPPEEPAGERSHREALRIRRFAGRMNSLIGDLLDVVSMESGKLSVDTAHQDATQLVNETMESFQLTAAARQVEMTSEVPDGPVFVSFDHDRVLQVLTNLIGNAMKFMKPGGSIAVRLAPTDDGLQFTVRDTGCGIAAHQLETIFERFSQAAQNDRRGLGLGLYISRCIILAHGGRIWAESELGKGSAFHFTLPATNDWRE